MFYFKHVHIVLLCMQSTLTFLDSKYNDSRVIIEGSWGDLHKVLELLLKDSKVITE